MNYGKVAENIRRELKDYIIEHDMKALVLGVSGGIDSALVAALAAPVCKELGIKLIGRSINITSSNKQEERDRAIAVGNAFCTDFKEVDLTEEFTVLYRGIDSLEGTIGEDIPDKMRLGNIKARIRMIYLMNLCQMNKGLLMSTDNFTELMCGFWTIFGDVGLWGGIQFLYKTEVFELSKWIANEELKEESYGALMSCVQATPTDGLGISNSDCEQLGVDNYDEADNILKSYLAGETLYLGHTLVKRVRASQFKRDCPINLTRDTVIKDA